MLHVTNGKYPLNIGSKVTIGHAVKLHGCTLKDLCLIGIGAIILDGAVVEEKSMVAAGSVVKPNFVVPTGKLVAGVPARIVRDLTTSELEEFEKSAQRYAGYTEITVNSLIKSLWANPLKNVSVTDKKKCVNKNAVHKLVLYLSKTIGFSVDSLQIIFINNREILELNKKHLSHDYTTDIITFDYSKNIELLDAEIYISLDEALLNSKKYKVNFEQELSRLVIHGILHLTGYDDKKVADKKNMKRMENRLLSNINFTLL